MSGPSQDRLADVAMDEAVAHIDAGGRAEDRLTLPMAERIAGALGCRITVALDREADPLIQGASDG